MGGGTEQCLPINEVPMCSNGEPCDIETCDGSIECPHGFLCTPEAIDREKIKRRRWAMRQFNKPDKITREQLINLDNISEEGQAFKRYFQKKNRPIRVPKKYRRD